MLQDNSNKCFYLKYYGHSEINTCSQMIPLPPKSFISLNFWLD